MVPAINYLVREKYDNSDDYDDRYLKVTINLDNDLLLEKGL